MKTIITLLSLLFLHTSLIEAAVNIPSFPEAQKKAKETQADFIVLLYGKDWDRFSNAYREKIWNNPTTFAHLEPNTIVCDIYYSTSHEGEEKKKDDKRNEGFKESIESYPSVYMFRADGTCYAILRGKEHLPMSAPALSKKMAQLQHLSREYEKLIALAEKAEGSEKAKLLGKAAELSPLKINKGKLLEEIKKADPEDSSGYTRRLSFSIWDLNQYLKEETPFEDAMKELDKMLTDPAYTTLQKQQIYLARGRVIKLKTDNKTDLINNYKMMEKLNPSSLYGKAAQQALELYCK